MQGGLPVLHRNLCVQEKLSYFLGKNYLKGILNKGLQIGKALPTKGIKVKGA